MALPCCSLGPRLRCSTDMYGAKQTHCFSSRVACTFTVLTEQGHQVAELPDFASIDTLATFDGELAFLCKNIPVQDDRVFLHRQVKLPDDEAEAGDRANALLEKVLDRGGEGVVIRDPQASWFPRRNRGLLKHKPFDDAEAVIVGFVAGKEGKQGNVLGKIGSLRVRWGEVEFEIGSGMTMAERELADDAHDYAAALPPPHLRRRRRRIRDTRLPDVALWFRLPQVIGHLQGPRQSGWSGT